MRKLSIRSSKNTYSALFIDDLKARLKKLNKKSSLHLLVDKNIWQNYRKIFENEKKYSSVKILFAKEDNKSLDTVSSYIEFLLSNKIHKDHKIVVIGGGLVQDIGSFTADIVLRGVDWVFIPTTLLSMSDSCVGSKSGINVGKYKNQAGTFHPPSEIYIYLPFVRTLPKSELINGYGEIVKHGLIRGGSEFKFIAANIEKTGQHNKLTEEIIYKSLLIKKKIVEKDEFEKDTRRLLNYGHTFGHALEGYTKHSISHGIGVFVGMDIANFISLKKGMLSIEDFNKIHSLIAKFTQDYKLSISNLDSYMDFVSHDKKVTGKIVHAILSEGIGKIRVTELELDSKLKKTIKEYFKEYQN